jgi:hypothetical protein
MFKFFDKKLKMQLAGRGISSGTLTTSVRRLIGGVMKQGSDMVDLSEDMLSARAVKGIRPLLYISSGTDLECSLLVLLGEAEGGRSVVPPPTAFKIPSCHFLKD